jgi:hypothetical protein
MECENQTETSILNLPLCVQLNNSCTTLRDLIDHARTHKAIMRRNRKHAVLLLWLIIAAVESNLVPCDDAAAVCRSNQTHLAWLDATEESSSAAIGEELTSRRLVLCRHCQWQTREQAEGDAATYLRRHVFSFELSSLQTMGFMEDSSFAPNSGLGNGLVGPTIQLALDAKIAYSYTDELPRAIWQEYVLNYAHLNEARSNWRPHLSDQLSRLVLLPDVQNISTVVHTVNQHMWTVLAGGSNQSIVFAAGSTPLVFDPMSVLVFKKASCTGTSILMAAALRALGVPARVAGTPAWYNDHLARGNHNWVEVWMDGKWYFVEPTLPTASEAVRDAIVDDLERDPCSRWFCHAHSNYGHGHNQTRVYAARLDTADDADDGNGVFFPLAWEWGNHDIPADDRTSFYEATCNKC